MDKLNKTGKYEIGTDLKKKLAETFYADYAGESETKETISHMLKDTNYLIDTHTAVAMSVANKYIQNTKDTKPMIIASTASAYKFAPAVLSAIGEDISKLDEFAQLDKLNKISGVAIPPGLSNLKTAEVLHTDICENNEMSNSVLNFAKW